MPTTNDTVGRAPRVTQLVTEVGSETATMTVYGDICADDIWSVITGGDDGATTSALDVAQAIAALPAGVTSIEVHINSYGGDVAEGVAMYNALRGSGREVTTVCDGFACSIASVVFMAGSRRVMRPASLLMLHEPSMPRAGGNAAQLRKQADDLDVISRLSKTAYLEPGGIDAETLDAVMAAETWVDPDQALEWGLATEVAAATDGGGDPTQSARDAVASALLRGPAPAQGPAIDYERLGQAIAEAMLAHGPAQQADPEPEPARRAEQEPEGGYALFSMLANHKED